MLSRQKVRQLLFVLCLLLPLVATQIPTGLPPIPSSVVMPPASSQDVPDTPSSGASDAGDTNSALPGPTNFPDPSAVVTSGPTSAPPPAFPELYDSKNTLVDVSVTGFTGLFTERLFFGRLSGNLVATGDGVFSAATGLPVMNYFDTPAKIRVGHVHAATHSVVLMLMKVLPDQNVSVSVAVLKCSPADGPVCVQQHLLELGETPAIGPLDGSGISSGIWFCGPTSNMIIASWQGTMFGMRIDGTPATASLLFLLPTTFQLSEGEGLILSSNKDSAENAVGPGLNISFAMKPLDAPSRSAFVHRYSEGGPVPIGQNARGIVWYTKGDSGEMRIGSTQICSRDFVLNPVSTKNAGFWSIVEFEDAAGFVIIRTDTESSLASPAARCFLQGHGVTFVSAVGDLGLFAEDDDEAFDVINITAFMILGDDDSQVFDPRWTIRGIDIDEDYLGWQNSHMLRPAGSLLPLPNGAAIMLPTERPPQGTQLPSYNVTSLGAPYQHGSVHLPCGSVMNAVRLRQRVSAGRPVYALLCGEAFVVAAAELLAGGMDVNFTVLGKFTFAVDLREHDDEMVKARGFVKSPMMSNADDTRVGCGRFLFDVRDLSRPKSLVGYHELLDNRVFPISVASFFHPVDPDVVYDVYSYSSEPGIAVNLSAVERIATYPSLDPTARDASTFTLQRTAALGGGFVAFALSRSLTGQTLVYDATGAVVHSLPGRLVGPRSGAPVSRFVLLAQTTAEMYRVEHLANSVPTFTSMARYPIVSFDSIASSFESLHFDADLDTAFVDLIQSLTVTTLILEQVTLHASPSTLKVGDPASGVIDLINKRGFVSPSNPIRVVTTSYTLASGQRVPGLPYWFSTATTGTIDFFATPPRQWSGELFNLSISIWGSSAVLGIRIQPSVGVLGGSSTGGPPQITTPSFLASILLTPESSKSAVFVPAVFEGLTSSVNETNGAFSAFGSTTSLNRALAELSVQPLTQDGLNQTVAMAVNDNVNNEVVVNVAMSSFSLNSAPVPRVNSLPNRSFKQGAEFSFTIPGDLFSDAQPWILLIEGQDGVTLPSWLSFDRITRVISGRSDAEQLTDLNIRATDGFAVSQPIILSLRVSNRAPYATNPLRPFTVKLGTPLTYELPGGTFFDDDDDPLRIDATRSDGQPLPSWLTYNRVSQALTGTATATAAELDQFTTDGHFNMTIGITFTATDGFGSGSTDLLLNVVDQEPVVTQEMPTVAFKMRAVIDVSVPPDLFADSDDSRLALTAMAVVSGGAEVTLPSWLTFDSFLRRFGGTAPDRNITTTIVIIASDGFLEARTRFNISVSNAAPYVQNGIPSLSAKVGNIVSYTIPQSTFADPNDSIASLVITVDGRPQWLSLDGWRLIGTAGLPVGYVEQFGNATSIPSYSQSFRLACVASDGVFAAEAPFDMTVFDAAPTIDGPLPPVYARAVERVTANLDTKAFSDADDSNLAITVRASDGGPLPIWMSFNERTLALTGTAPQSLIGSSVILLVRVSDGFLHATSTWEWFVMNNSAPIVGNSLGKEIAWSSSTFTFTVPSWAFSDPDNDTLTYAAVQEGTGLLPGFLQFDAAAGTLTGRPSTDDSGDYRIAITASDGLGGTAVSVLELTVYWSPIDVYLTVSEYGGILLGIIGFVYTLWAKQGFLWNVGCRGRYTRSEAPPALLAGQPYQPRNPSNDEPIEPSTIASVQVFIIDGSSTGAKIASCLLPDRVAHLVKRNELRNGRLLPSWLTFEESGTITVDPDNTPWGDGNLYELVVFGHRTRIHECIPIDCRDGARTLAQPLLQKNTGSAPVSMVLPQQEPRQLLETSASTTFSPPPAPIAKPVNFHDALGELEALMDAGQHQSVSFNQDYSDDENSGSATNAPAEDQL